MEGFDYGQARFWVDMLQLAGLVVLGVYTHITRRSAANTAAIDALGEQTQERIDGVGQRMSNLEQRVAVMESQISQAPTHHDLAILHKRVTRAAEQMEHLTGEFRASNRQLSLICEHLLNDKRGN